MAKLVVYYNFASYNTGDFSVPNAAYGSTYTSTGTYSPSTALNTAWHRIEGNNSIYTSNTLNRLFYFPTTGQPSPTFSSLSGGISISLWKRRAATSAINTTETILALSDGSNNISIGDTTTKQFLFTCNSTTLTIGNWEFNYWHHIVWIIQPSKWTIFIDGVCVTLGIAQPSPLLNPLPTSLGGVLGANWAKNTTSNTFLAEFRLYDGVLSTDQAYTLYDRATLVKYYRFEAGDVLSGTPSKLANMATGLPVYDTSFNDNANNLFTSANFFITNAKSICGSSSLYYSPYPQSSPATGTNSLLIPGINLQSFELSYSIWFYSSDTFINGPMTLFTLNNALYNYRCSYNSLSSDLIFQRTDASSATVTTGLGSSASINNIGSPSSANTLRLPQGVLNVAKGQWHHVVWILSVSTWTIWIDNTMTYLDSSSNGMAAALTTTAGSPNFTSSLLYDSAVGAASSFNGYIDDLRIYNRLLNDNDVRKLFQTHCISTNYYDSAGNDLVSVYLPYTSGALSTTTNYVIESGDDLAEIFQQNDSTANQQPLTNKYALSTSSAPLLFATIEPNLAFRASGYYTVIDYGTGYYTVVFTDYGSISFSSSVSTVALVAIGGGGGGGNSLSTSNYGAGGGAGGYVVVNAALPITPYLTYTCDVGKGGSSGDYGSKTMFGDSLVLAIGGNGGKAAAVAAGGAAITGSAGGGKGGTGTTGATAGGAGVASSTAITI